MDVYKPTGRRKYRFDYKGKVHHTGMTDLKAARQVMNDTIRRYEREAAGLPVAAQEKRTGPVEPLIDAFADDLARLGRTGPYVDRRRLTLKKIFNQLHWPSLAAVRVDPFATWLKQWPAARTQNDYRASLYSFAQFCCARGWLEDNPLKHFRPAPQRKTRYRRAYTHEELARLCQTPNGQLYLVAALSGFRLGELGRMEQRDLDPYATQPTWHPRPEITKSGRKTGRMDIVPILPEVLPTVRELWDRCRLPTDKLFPRIPWQSELAKDRQTAGIVNPDAHGRYADFHSLRYTFCTILAKVMPIHQVQRFMRHASVKETSQIYLDLGLTDLWAAAQSLPALGLLLPQPLPPTLPLPEKSDNSQANLTIAL